MYKFLFVLACIPALAIASYPVVQCAAGPTPLAVRIDGCSGPPCQVQRGGVVTFEWDFIAHNSDFSLNLHIIAALGGAQITVPLDPALANACNGLTVGSCPYQAGQQLTHRVSIPVPVFVPVGQVFTLIASLNNGLGTVVCAQAQGYAV